ncbi:MAG: hypothetical protein RIE53_13265 [Rhodothermales bacterium]
MISFVHYIPILTTLLAVPFSIRLYRHWRKKPSALYLFWWMLGVIMYGVGTLTESLTTVLGWQEGVFRAWYISGALLGGAPLAQGTIYLLMKRRTAHVLTGLLIVYVAVAAGFVLVSPIDYILVEAHRLSGSVLEWQWVRLFSPIVNLYAFLFLAGGAAWSAWKYRHAGAEFASRVNGNALIAVGALLPGIGGSFTRAGYVEVLYVTELLGLSLIWWGYHVMVRNPSGSVHANQG